jgi:hypothetical protein
VSGAHLRTADLALAESAAAVSHDDPYFLDIRVTLSVCNGILTLD